MALFLFLTVNQSDAIWAPRTLLQDERMLVSNVWSPITTSDFKRMHDLPRGQTR